MESRSKRHKSNPKRYLNAVPYVEPTVGQMVGYTPRALQRAVKREVQRNKIVQGCDIGLITQVGSAIATDMTTNADIFWVNNIDMGDGNLKRNNATVFQKSIRLRMRFATYFYHKEILGYVLGQMLRVSVIFDKKPDLAIPTINEVFANITTGGAKTTNFFSSLSFNETDRFKVLREEIFCVNPGALALKGIAGDYIEYLDYRDWYIPLKGKRLEYKRNIAVPGGVHDTEYGAIYVMVRAAYAETDHIVSTCQINSRLRWTEG